VKLRPGSRPVYGAAEEEYDTTGHSSDPVVNPEKVNAPYDTQDFGHEFGRMSMLEHESAKHLTHALND
jgi:hypothetical protein